MDNLYPQMVGFENTLTTKLFAAALTNILRVNVFVSIEI